MSDELAEVLPDGVIVLDGAGVISEVNRAASEMTGYPAGQLLGKPCGSFLDARDARGRPLLRGGWGRAASLRSTSRIPEQIVMVKAADGHDALLTVTGRYLRAPDGTLRGAVLGLRESRRHDHASSGAIEIVSTVSHELRSPLTSVKGYTSLMLNRWDRLQDSQKQMMLQQVNHDADRVTRLITELLDISRLESGRLVLRRQLLDLAHLALNVVGKVRLAYPELDARMEFEPGLPKVYADPDKIEQVLTNLVENACKYGSPRGMEIRGERRDGAVSVAVTDRGVGIPAADLPKVFTKFFRRDLGKPTGSGLGLWISRGLVEAHGGELTAESAPGQGSTFCFSLPLVDLDALDAR